MNINNAQAKRVITLAPSLTEILFEFEIGHFIVGTTRYSNYPLSATKIPLVGDYISPSIEKIISLKPDFVLALNEGVDLISHPLKKAEIPLVILNGKRLTDYVSIVQQIGNLLSKEDKAQELITRWNKEWSLLSPLSKKINILIEIEHEPLVVSGGETFLDDALAQCGLINVFHHQKGYLRLQKEILFKKKINLILFLGAHSMDFSLIKNDWLKNPATKSALMIQGESDALSRLGPRLVPAIRKLCDEINKKLSTHFTDHL